VASFNLQLRNDDEALNTRIERLMEWWGEPANCDVRRVHPFWRFGRLAEAMAVIDGDFGVLKLADGRVQGIEGDRIRTPSQVALDLPEGSKCTHGVITDRAGAPQGYCVCRRGTSAGSFELERIVSAENLLQHSYYDRIDQVRGVSPLSSALNRFRDTYEAIEFALVKAKICQLFGVKWKRTGANAFPGATQDGSTQGSPEGQPAGGIDFGKGGWNVDLMPGEDVEFMESSQPSTQFQTFMEKTILLALKSLDIPYSFFSEDFSTYSGSRQAWIQYDQAAEQKRRNLRLLLDAITRWKFAQWIAAGTLVLPGKMTLFDMDWEWIATGVPWIDPLKEVQADAMAVDRGFDSTVSVVRRSGRDAYQLAREEQKYQEYRQQKLKLPAPGQVQIVQVPPSDEEKPAKGKQEPAR
jgi:capsid protein